jgi:hypothetical protein
MRGFTFCDLLSQISESQFNIIMKKVLALLLLASPFYSLAQSNLTQTGRKEKFCVVYVHPAGSKYEIDIDDGTKKITKITELKDEKGKTVEFDSVVAILDYMSQRGWVLSTSASNIIQRGTTASFVLIYKQLLAN